MSVLLCDVWPDAGEMNEAKLGKTRGEMVSSAPLDFETPFAAQAKAQRPAYS